MAGFSTYIEHNKEEIELADKNFPGPVDFVHLHNHTMFSPLDGVPTPEEYFDICKNMNMKAFAITDHGTMASFPDAYISSKKHKVKFIPGNEMYYNEYHETLLNIQESGSKLSELKESNPDLHERIRRNRHITILTKDNTGYKNLLNMNREAWSKRFYNKYARISQNLLENHNEGLIVLSGCLNGPVSYELRQACFAIQDGNSTKAKELINNAHTLVKKFLEIFGDRYYIEHQMPGETIEFSKEVFIMLAGICKKFNIKGVLANDCHYTSRKDFELQKAMMAIKQELVINSPDLFHVNSNEQFFKTRSQLRETFYKQKLNESVDISHFEQICDNTVEVAERCEGFKPDLSPKLPEIEDSDRILFEKVKEGLEKKGLWNSKKKYNCDGKMVTYREQAIIELNRFIEKKFASYFLIIQDLVNFSRKELQMPVGPGRGSCGGSVVCYALDVHDMPSLDFGLSSSRFLSESRGGYMLNLKPE